MLVMPTPGAIETYKDGRWADTMPLLLRALLIQAFQYSGRIAGVGAIASGLHGDYLLSIDLYDFETQYRDGAPHAVIRLNAKLIDQSQNRVAAARMLRSRRTGRRSTSRRCRAAAFEQALNELLPEIVAGRSNRAKRSGRNRNRRNRLQARTRRICRNVRLMRAP